MVIFYSLVVFILALCMCSLGSNLAEGIISDKSSKSQNITIPKCKNGTSECGKQDVHSALHGM